MSGSKQDQNEGPTRPRQMGAELKPIIAPQCQDISQTETLPNIKPALTFDELREIATWQGLKDAYSKKGLTFSDDAGYLKQVEEDWAKVKSILWAKMQVAQLPDKFPMTTVVVDNKPVDIVGIVHTLSMHGDVFAILHNTINKFPILIAENNLGLGNLGIFTRGFDVNDHGARGLFDRLVNWELNLFRAIKRNCRRQILKFKIGNSLPLDGAVTPQGQAFERFQKKFGYKDSWGAEFSKGMLHLPGDYSLKVPANIDLAHKHERNLPYTRDQARSAFLAEFIRFWNIEETLKHTKHQLDPAQIAEVTARKAIVSGGYHRPEIAFFLLHGSREEKVTARARHDAEVVNKEGIEGFARLHNKYALQFFACTSLLALAQGSALGLLFSRVLDYVLNHFIK